MQENAESIAISRYMHYPMKELMLKIAKIYVVINSYENNYRERKFP